MNTSPSPMCNHTSVSRWRVTTSYKDRIYWKCKDCPQEFVPTRVLRGEGRYASTLECCTCDNPLYRCVKCTHDLGRCPIIVHDHGTAEQAGKWAEEEARKRLEPEEKACEASQCPVRPQGHGHTSDIDDKSKTCEDCGYIRHPEHIPYTRQEIDDRFRSLLTALESETPGIDGPARRMRWVKDLRSRFLP